MYGGWDGHLAYNSLHKLDVLTMTWAVLKPDKGSEIPMAMSGCGLVSYGKNKLVLFGGCGVPTEDSQPQQQSGATKSGSGAVNLTTVKTPEPSKGGASQEEAQEEAEPPKVNGSGGMVTTVEAEVHSQPDPISTSELTDHEAVLGLYDLAASQVSNKDGSQEALLPGEDSVSQGSKTEQGSGSQADSRSQKVAGEEKEVNGEVPPPQQNGEVESPSQGSEGTRTESSEKLETPKHSQEGGSEGEKTPTHSQGEEVKIDLSKEEDTAAPATPTQQNGTVEEEPSPKETESKPQPMLEVQPQLKGAEKGEESEEEDSSDSESEGDVMDRQWTNELKVFDLQESEFQPRTVYLIM